MNQEPLSFTLTQISYLTSNLNKKNFSQNTKQIALLVKPFGLEADRHFLRCLFSNIDFTDPSGAAKNSLQAKLLAHELGALLNKSSLITNICFAVDNVFGYQNSLKPVTPSIFVQFNRALNCSPILEVCIALALTHSSNSELSRLADQQLRVSLASLIHSYVESDSGRPNQEGSLNDISPELLQLILSLLSHGKHTRFGLSDSAHQQFSKQLARDFPRDRVPLILAPLIYTEDTEVSVEKMSANSQGILTSAIMDTSWSNIVMDIGYAFTSNVDDCKTHLLKTGGRDLTAADIAKIVSLMCRTHTNLSDCSINLPNPSSFWNNSASSSTNKDSKGGSAGITMSSAELTTWKPEVFVQALKEAAPELSWKDVCAALDHPDFMIKDRGALNLLMSIVRLGLTVNGLNGSFPAEFLYRRWANVEGQLSIYSMILKNPDIFSFADHIFTSVSVDLLKTPPEADNKELGAWKSLHVVDILLYIADNGFVNQVIDLFKAPVGQCPDVLFMALLQISPPLTVLRHDMFNTLVPIFLGNHPNSGAILHHAWNSTNFANNLKHIIMHSMSEWYMRGDCDQSRLSRILDVAQDLKALSSLLSTRVFMFVIDLACLASRREYLKLDKWTGDKIREHGDKFVQAIIKFLQRRCPQIMGASILDDQLPKSAQLPGETLNTILTCLQACVANVQPELADIIMTMTSNCNLMLNKSRQQQQQQQQQQQVQQQPLPGVLRAHRGIETPFSAGNLGGQMFAGSSGDSIPNLGSNMPGLNLGASGAGNVGGFNFGNMISAPASPSRLLQAPSNSPFPIMSLPNNAQPINNLGRIAQQTPTGDKLMANTPFPEMSQNLSKEVEDEANSYFQRIYNHPPHPTLSIDEVLEMLQRFQDSQNRREREVYQCMLRNLFEEYRFFPQYPEKELQITAQLFGGMVERNLVTTYIALGLALRYVLDALRKPEGSKMYFFGITALDRFKTKLHLYQKYCEHVRSIPHFNDFPPHIVEYVEFGAQGQEPTNKPQLLSNNLNQMMPQSTVLFKGAPVANPGSSAASAKQPPNTPSATAIAQASRNIKSIANATNINTLLVATDDREEKITLPPDSVQDKTAFIFNNLSQLNLQTKCDEIREILLKEYWAWLSQYLVLKRASIELNFHALYSNFLDALKIPEIIRMVTKETFRNIRVLLRSDKGIENFSDRSLLKNLGHWLGMMTLGRNRPILQIDIDLKSLLVEAYHKGEQELLYVVPFVAKIIQSCAKSKVFKPPNPWTMAIMNVLAEMHQEPGLKLNLKFEIEVLCKTLAIDVADLKPVVYLMDLEKAAQIEFQLNSNKHKDQLQNQQQHQPHQQIIQAIMPAEELPHQIAPNAQSPCLADGAFVAGPPEPRFAYSDINVNSLANLVPHIVFSANLPFVHNHPHVKQFVRTAIERTINEWIQPVVDRAVRIGVGTTEQITRKDFALDYDDTRMRSAALFMTRNLTAGMAMITCKDQMVQSITNHLKTTFAAAMAPQSLDLPDAAANQLAIDNAELACVFIQKTAIEKAIPEIEKRLAADFELRKLARQEGRRYCDTSVVAYQNERMPELIRQRVGSVNTTRFSVYEEFARNIPGFQPMTERELALIAPPNNLPEAIQAPFPSMEPAPTEHISLFGTNEIVVLYEEIGHKMETYLNSIMNIPALQVQVSYMHSLLEAIMIARRSRDNLSAANLLNKAVDGIMEGLTGIGAEHSDLMKVYRELHLRVIRLMQNTRIFGANWTNKAVTKHIVECREEARYNMEAVDLLISSSMVNMGNYDGFISQIMDNGNNYMATSFAMQLVKYYFIDERPNPLVTENDFFNTIELLVRLAPHLRAPEGLPHLIEMLRLNHHDPNTLMLDRMGTGPTQHIHSGIMQVRSNDFDDPPGLVEKAEYLLKDWVTIYHTQVTGRDPIKSFGLFVSKMNMYGILKTDDLITRFFRQATQICIDLAYRNLNDPTQSTAQAKAKIFQWIDAFVRLIALIVKHSGETGNSTTKINLLNKILGIVIGVLLQDQETQGVAFQQVGYHRLFIMLFLELTAPEPILENISLSVVTAFCHTYHILRPSMAPGFCYSWLELISHRVFIGRILAMIPQQKGWALYSNLLMDLFKYLAPFLRNAELAKPVQQLYKGTLRVLLVLLHDFPEFLCDYHFGFCDVIPPNCIQMRNLILAAFPRNMRLPDPFTPNLKVDMLNEIASAPRIFTNYVQNIQPAMFKKELDSYLKARAPVTFLSELRSHIQISNECGLKYNVLQMNSLVLYVGTQAIAHIRSKNLVPNMTTIVHSAHMDIFQNLAVDLDTEGRYLFLNAIANQLRYPNSHTHYFSCALLYLFVEANSEAIQEQITRVLLERLIVNRPHPWGLLITFIELIKNPVYKFWDHDFVHCAPEIEKLFESVARSCMVVKSNTQQIQSAENELQECN